MYVVLQTFLWLRQHNTNYEREKKMKLWIKWGKWICTPFLFISILQPAAVAVVVGCCIQTAAACFHFIFIYYIIATCKCIAYAFICNSELKVKIREQFLLHLVNNLMVFTYFHNIFLRFSQATYFSSLFTLIQQVIMMITTAVFVHLYCMYYILAQIWENLQFIS